LSKKNFTDARFFYFLLAGDLKLARKRPEFYNYYGSEAEEYASSQWMKENQEETTERAVDLMESDFLGGLIPQEPEHVIVLDIGAGCGYSTDILNEYGFVTIAMDLSIDMLSKNQNENRILADLRQHPFRNTIIDYIISVSAFNFASSGAKSKDEKKRLITKSIEELYRISKPNSRIVIEFYPEKEELDMFLDAFRKIGFDGGLIIDDPDTKTEKKFAILKRKK
jgi:18S rRNA (guanine1575-N7)-methyltransferase